MVGPPRRVNRFQHFKDITPASDRSGYELGQKQRETSLEQFHYLCAASIQAFTSVDASSRHLPFGREELEFSKYTDFPLKNITDLKLHLPRPNGSVNPGDIRLYVDNFTNDWQCREGGILRCTYDVRAFWNLVMNFHSKARTTGIQAFDDLLIKLKFEERRPSIVPCQFFAREAGCLDPECPFLHDAEACMREREAVLNERRMKLDQVTSRESMNWYKKESGQLWDQFPQLKKRFMDGKRIPEEDRIRADQRRIRRVCANPECLAVHWKEPVPEGRTQVDMRRCSRCAVTYYCSGECQKKDWKRHKKEPCLPYEELVDDDDLWGEWGQRKGTENQMFNFSEG
ncbi:hypothetical protein EIP91_003188 [Steccherinum ochraceum]|uniref:MYND-type domain-containing protein n=1 Tax=Steccherinum ochraceum TaxID=92696 RepID=A0A4R0RXR6_9APHY|nr:hypothetical protein EIP91_003188 [Steccherinum ochraceum]